MALGRLNKSRGGAPKGERADRKARAASADAATGWMRLSALRFPFALWLFRIVKSWRDVGNARNAEREYGNACAFFQPCEQ